MIIESPCVGVDMHNWAWAVEFACISITDTLHDHVILRVNVASHLVILCNYTFLQYRALDMKVKSKKIQVYLTSRFIKTIFYHSKFQVYR